MLATLDMSSTHLFGPRGHSDHIHDDLSIVSRGGSSSPSLSYENHELDPFSAASEVSSFNYPAAADSTLLTPVSSAGSSPVHHRAAPETTPTYVPSQSAASGVQGPTPPSTARMYYSSYDMSSSKSSSPIPVHAQVTEAGSFDMNHFVTAHSSPSGHQPPSPRDEIPPQIDPYLGHYSVSVANELDCQHQYYDHHPFPHVQVAPASPNWSHAQQPQQHPPAQVTAAHLHPSLTQPTPILPQSHPSQYRPQQGTRVGEVEDLRGPPVMLPPHGSFAVQQPPVSASRRTNSRKKGAARPRKASRTSKTPNTSPQAQPDGHSQPGPAGSATAADNGEQGKKFITLADACTADDKSLFAIRLKYDHLKGKGMWDSISAEYDNESSGKAREALQMRVQRMVAKYGQWPEDEDERLLNAYEWCHANFPRLVLQRLKETGGAVCWEWKPEHIETRLVQKGLMEPKLDGKGTRRRKKILRRRDGSQPHYPPLQGAVGGDWNNALGLQSAGLTGPMNSQFDVISSEGSVQPPQLPTADETAEVIDCLFGPVDFKTEAESSMSPDAMSLAYHDDEAGAAAVSAAVGSALNAEGRATRLGSNQANGNPMQQHSERVARQACEQLMRVQYGGGRH